MYLFSLRGLLVSISSSYLYPCFLALLLLFTDPVLKPIYLAIMAAFSLLASIVLFKRFRTLKDTATTSLRNTAQGYVEIVGNAMTFPEETGPGPFHLPPVVWFSTPKQQSTDGFLVNDEFGCCTVDPQKAEVITPLFHRQQHWYRAIYPGEKVYVLGQLTTLNTHYTDTDKRTATLHLLADWKKDHIGMLQRFDSNSDGKIDQQELMVARQKAEEVVENNHDHEYKQTASHIVEKTDDGRPFIISSIPIDVLLKRYSYWMMVHLIAWPVLSIISMAI